MPKSARFYEWGSGTVYFLLLAGAVGIALLGMQRKGTQDLSRARLEKLEVARASLYRRIKTLASSDEVLRFSLSNADSFNNNFKTCMNTTPLSGTSICGFSFLTTPALGARKSLAEFHLYNPPNSTTRVTDQQYTDKGELCSANPGQPCVFRARSFYLRDCVNASPCATRYLTLVQVDYIPPVPPTPGIPLLASVPTNAAFANYLAFANEANLNSIVNPSTQDCPLGSMVDRVSNGMIFCKCTPGIAIQTGTNAVTGQPVCQLQKFCAPTENFKGFTSTGAAICTSPTESNCTVVLFAGGSVDCGNDSSGQRKAMKSLDIDCCGMIPSGSKANGPYDVWDCKRGTACTTNDKNYVSGSADTARATCCSLNP